MIQKYHRVWIAHIICVLNDACGEYFSFEDISRSDGKSQTIEQQYERARLKLSRQESPREVIRDGLITRQARCYMELDTFDEAVHAAGYDTEAVNRFFALMQHVIDYEKKLYDEFHGK